MGTELTSERAGLRENIIGRDSLNLATAVRRQSRANLFLPRELDLGRIVLRTVVQAGDQSVSQCSTLMHRKLKGFWFQPFQWTTHCSLKVGVQHAR
jgi:hypothetical protein